MHPFFTRMNMRLGTCTECSTVINRAERHLCDACLAKHKAQRAQEYIDWVCAQWCLYPMHVYFWQYPDGHMTYHCTFNYDQPN